VRLAICLALAAAARAGPWEAETVLEAPALLGGCAVGDLDPRRAGNEIAAVSSNGEVHVAWREEQGWRHEVVARLKGEMIQCAVGDADPGREGNELVVVGMAEGDESSGGAGAAHLVWLDGGTWRERLLFRDDALVHGVCIGDLDSARAGNEILAVGFSGKATMLFRDGDAWGSEVAAADLGGAGKNAVAYGGGAVVASTGGTLLHLKKGPAGWTSAVLDRAPAGQARVGTDGERLLAARDDGALGLVAGGARTDIHKAPKKLRGAVLADLDRASPGVEAATVGYDAKATVLYPDGKRWRAVTAFEDAGPLHHLAFGDLPGGAALVTCGHSGRLTVLRSPSSRG
jgi:hypothetical protein